MSEKENNLNRRKIITITTIAAGAIAGVGASVPFIASLKPSEKARAAGAPVTVNPSLIQPGMLLTIEWRGKPIWVMKRTETMLASLEKNNDYLTDPQSNVPLQPDYAKNSFRSIKGDILVLVGVCTHLGCSPVQKLEVGESSGMGSNWNGGFYCPCHGSKFDLAGRVYKGAPAPVNLEVPPHYFASDDELIIGEDQLT